jgi:hypothetical protein
MQVVEKYIPSGAKAQKLHLPLSARLKPLPFKAGVPRDGSSLLGWKATKITVQKIFSQPVKPGFSFCPSGGAAEAAPFQDAEVACSEEFFRGLSSPGPRPDEFFRGRLARDVLPELAARGTEKYGYR